MRSPVMRLTRRPSSLWLLALVLVLVSACAPSDASKARSRSVIQSGEIVRAEELRVAEYLSYYEQHFPEPRDATLGLDVRLGNPTIPADGGEAWLQLGVQARSGESDIVAPLNLALVIDCSGSMGADEKMPYVKQSLGVFLQSLSPQDIVAIVAYSDQARVVLPAQRVDDGRWVDSTIASLRPGGNTNLYGGLMLGFQEAKRNYDIRRNNRVILLTDGIANVGVTDSRRIAADALAYNERGIYLSTIGLGHDYNDALLSELATQGKGAYHFIDSAAEMDKVFRQEVTGLVQKAASDVSIVLSPVRGVQPLSITGFDGQPPSGPIEIRLRDMGTGDSQVVLVHLGVGRGPTGRFALAEAELRYTDLFSQRQETVRVEILADGGRSSYYDPLQDVEVLRNVTIQRTAEGLKEIDRLYQARQYQAAWNLAYELELDLHQVADLTGEAQMYEDASMMRRYEDTLQQWVRTETGRLPVPPEDAGYGEREGIPVPTQNVIEIK